MLSSIFCIYLKLFMKMEISCHAQSPHIGLQDASTLGLLGDETTLGLFTCLVSAARGRCIGAIEVGSAAQRDRPALVGLDLTAVERSGSRGEALLAWIEEADLSPGSDVCFYLAGHTGSIVRMRERLLRWGWPKRNIRTKPYWADGKRGL